MNRRHLANACAALLIIAVLFVAVIPLRNVFSNPSSDVHSPPDVRSASDYTPIMRIPADVDKNHDGIEDSFDQEITDRLGNGTAQEYVNVTVMLRTKPTAYDADVFVSSGGYLTTSPWTHAVYGFGGRIPYSGIAVFAKQCPDVLLVEKEAIGHSSLAYASTQVGARTYVWSTLGLQGDANSSIAILDSGIDDSHPDFSPGFGDQNFSEKIVGWNDQIDNTTTSPYDDNGHGSHVSGIAAGDGFFSLDALGYANATWGANLGSSFSTGTYLKSGIMVNKTGTITIKVKWVNTIGTAKLSSLQLYYSDKDLSSGSWTQVASVSTPGQNTSYALTYSVASTPSGGYDMYHVLLNLTAGTGDLFAVFTMSWPYTPPADGFPAWTGIAPQAKLVEVKVIDSWGAVTSTGLINGIDWVIANRATYHITVASMSIAFPSEDSNIDSAVASLVNSGITTVVASGNRGTGTNRIYTPGSVDEVITVAAMNQFDGIANYSSEGGKSNYLGNTSKPDITAPGGSFYAVPLFSADSNDNDATGGFADVQANDSASLQGTSMATPIVAGAAEILVQALGGYNAWNYTRSQALLPKMLLLMTATETYPNLREGGTTSTSPTLERGGKDVHEGYGRLNLDAAAEAVLKTYQIGTTVSDTLGTPPTLTDISVLGQRLAWARNVQLVSGFKYNFTLSVPAGADYDLYLYNSTGNTYGEPAIVANSTIAITGGTETFNVTAPYTGTYYIVVKRVTEATGSGTFNLNSTSSGPSEIIVDDAGAVFVGSWPSSSYISGYYGSGYRYHVAGTGVNTATWSFNVPSAGSWEVFARWTSYANRATNARYAVNYVGGSSVVQVNQEVNGGSWQSLGTFSFNAAAYSVVLSDNANEIVIADAVRLVYVAPLVQYSLTVNVVGSGSVTKNPDLALYNAGTVVTLTANPAASYVFAGWSGALTGNANPTTITMNGDKTVTATFAAASSEIIVDDAGAVFVGTWGSSTFCSGYYGVGYRYNSAGTGVNTATWSFNVPSAGSWQVFARWTSYSNRATNAKYTVNYVGGSSVVQVNQEVNGGSWQSLGTFSFNAAAYSVVLSDNADGTVIADAIRLVWVP